MRCRVCNLRENLLYPKGLAPLSILILCFYNGWWFPAAIIIDHAYFASCDLFLFHVIIIFFMLLISCHQTLMELLDRHMIMMYFDVYIIFKCHLQLDSLFWWLHQTSQESRRINCYIASVVYHQNISEEILFFHQIRLRNIFLWRCGFDFL